MSISSCPRCAGQVSLPVGVSNGAKVRCPLCKASFSLADALVNMPPLLEVIEDPIDNPPDDWFAPSGIESAPVEQSSAANETAGVLNLFNNSDEPVNDEPLSDQAANDLSPRVDSSADEMGVEHDDFAMQE